MPYKRPGEGVYVTNETGGNLTHGQPFVDKTKAFVGVAVKQKAVGFAEGMAAQAVIPDDEEFFLITKGVVQVAEVSGFAVGDDVWIDPTDNKLTETAEKNVKFGRVVEIENERGTPANKVRIDLDAKDSF
jgi:hypothetical protein